MAFLGIDPMRTCALKRYLALCLRSASVDFGSEFDETTQCFLHNPRDSLSFLARNFPDALKQRRVQAYTVILLNAFDLCHILS